jgi:hypothetical protein
MLYVQSLPGRIFWPQHFVLSTKVGGSKISSANPQMFRNKITSYIFGPSANVGLCGFAIYSTNPIFFKLGICYLGIFDVADQSFLAHLKLP